CAVKKALESSAVPVLLGGEHTVSYGMAKALFEKYGRDFGIIHFDSHGDLRPEYYGNRFSHACVMRRIVEDFQIPLMQIGTRAYCMKESKYRIKNGISSIDADRIINGGIPKKIIPRSFPKKVFISFDVDVLDPSIMPSTGTPEPGGLLWNDVIKILSSVSRQVRIIAFDLVELAPIPSMHHADYTVAKLAYFMMQLCPEGKSDGRTR
ncbi:MAG TPA: arginase family protein, partial [Victivallales bacterium]|nr:arginase family protein [Victivallales bacterium]